MIKADDDCLLNIFGIKYYVNEITSQFDGPFLACMVYKQGSIAILRSVSLKLFKMHNSY